MTWKGLENLAHAIVKQACMDYMCAQSVIDQMEDPDKGLAILRKRVRRSGVTDEELMETRASKLNQARETQEECVAFFTNPGLFEKMYNLDGDWFLFLIQKKYRREQAEGRREFIKIK